MGKSKIKKSRFLWGVPLALISFEIYLGVILGYLCGMFFAGKYDGHQRVKSIIFNIGKYRLHLHHWLVCLVILVPALLYNFFPFLPQFFSGILGGLIIQDLHLDDDWHRVLTKGY